MKKFVVTLFFAFCATASFANTNDADLAKSKVEVSSTKTDTAPANLSFFGCNVIRVCGHIAVACDQEDVLFWFNEYCQL